jgi:hypothetical protein
MEYNTMTMEELEAEAKAISAQLDRNRANGLYDCTESRILEQHSTLIWKAKQALMQQDTQEDIINTSKEDLMETQSTTSTPTTKAQTATKGDTMSIKELETQALIAELVARGVLDSNFADKEAKRLERAKAKAERQASLNTAKTGILEALSNPDLQGQQYFSVKKTGNSIGFMDHVAGERSTILKALTNLVDEGKIRKIGLVGGEEKLASEVNAFQIRYARPVVEEVKEEETGDESAEAK